METTTKTRRQRLQAFVPTALSGTALVLAMSGTAFALPGTETVNSGDIKNNTIKSIDLKDNQAVQSVDVRDATLTTDDVADETLTGTDVRDDSIASADVTDESLTGGDVDDDSLSGADVANGTLSGDDIANETVGADDLGPNSVLSGDIVNGQVNAEDIGDGIVNRFATVTIAGGTAQNSAVNTGEAVASCLAGEELISGAAFWLNGQAQEELYVSGIFPNHGAETVSAIGANDSGQNRILVAVASCLG